ncbi:MAG: Eco57I restriction-modification methylase domain-containing protein [Candidatus Helarchaeota archaeon]
MIQQNLEFIEKINNNEVKAQEFYAELLRIIYRIIFILYAEQRAMLPGAGTLYFDQFSLSSFRMLAEKPIKADKNNDLWNKLFITFNLVREGNEILEVPCYNGGLFKDEKLPIILGNRLKISNDLLLRIIRLLTSSTINNVLQRINFSEIREEEIGSIYESLLDYKPIISLDSRFQLILQTIERKSTGSYYTPKELIDILIRTTLQPLIEDRLSSVNDYQEKETILLDLKICDPACGGGTFLLAGLDFLGKKLAEVRTRARNPSEEDLQIARREILQHCIYGVDKNPLAVELAKISLWLRACVKDKPLNFLDNHIKLGNSLIGLGQKEEIKNIIPEAFKALNGNKATGIPPENKKLQDSARKIIKNEEKIQKIRGNTSRLTAFLTDKKTADICSKEFQKLIDLEENTPESIYEKEKKYKNLRNYPEYQLALTEANIWTSTFFWPLEGTSLGQIPSFVLIDELRNGLTSEQNNQLLNRIDALVKNYLFFHWYIEFPEVFSSDRKGFDCILTNPPWETLEFKEMEFFAGRDDQILSAPNQSERRKRIKALIHRNPELHHLYKKKWQSLKKEAHFLSNSGIFDLSAKGKLNTYAVFVERCWNIISSNGYLGIIAPTGVIMNFHMKDLFRHFVRNNAIRSFFDFINKNKLFDIIPTFRFCLLSLGRSKFSQEIIPMMFYTTDPKEVQEPLSLIFEDKQNLKERIGMLPDNHSLIPLFKEDFELFNPNTITCPSFRTKKDIELLRFLYQQTQILIKKNPSSGEIESNPWNINFLQMINMSSDSNLFHSEDVLRSINAKGIEKSSKGMVWNKNGDLYFPLYEGRMIWHFNHRFNSMTFAKEGGKMKGKGIKPSEEELRNPYFFVSPNYWVKERDIKENLPESYHRKWLLGFRDVSGTEMLRTLILSFMPYAAVGHTVPLIISDLNPDDLCLLYANLASLVIDYITRIKIPRVHVSYFVLEQLPIFPPEAYSKKIKGEIFSRVLELVYTAHDLEEFARDCGFKGPPFKWEPERRAILQAELDAIYAHLYRVNKKDLEYILDTFTRLKEKEMEEFNEFKTRRLVLDAYEQFAAKKELFD